MLESYSIHTHRYTHLVAVQLELLHYNIKIILEYALQNVIISYNKIKPNIFKIVKKKSENSLINYNCRKTLLPWLSSTKKYEYIL